jgi:uncharacterized membrane protein (GlpM family)
LPETFFLPIFIKFLSTALIVIAVIQVASKLGPSLGGVIGGMPVILGPGFFFITHEQSHEFVAQAAISSAHSLTATAAFAAGYIVAAKKYGAIKSLQIASAVWVLTSTVLFQFPLTFETALLSYAAIFVASRYVAHRSCPTALTLNLTRRPNSWSSVTFRALLAGLSVGLSSFFGLMLGPEASGLILGFPVATIVIAYSLHTAVGREVSRPTARASITGMLSVSCFAFVIAWLAQHKVDFPDSFLIALSSSLVVSGVLAAFSVFVGRRRHP